MDRSLDDQSKTCRPPDKQLKNNKAPGPDKIPNEIFINANQTTREIYLKEINKIIQSYDIPDQLVQLPVVSLQ